MRETIKDIKKYLPEGWEEKCKELKALSRGRQIKTPEELLELNLLYLTLGGSFGTTASLINMTTDKVMSKKAVYTRIQNSGDWLKWMSKEMCIENDMLIPKPDWLDKNVVLVDGSVLSVKGSQKGDYILHYAFNLFEFTSSFEITDMSKGESLLNYQLSSDDIVIGDRGYVSIKGMEYAHSCGADFILRYRSKAFNLFDADGNKIVLLDILRDRNLKSLESISIDCFYISKGKKKPVRIVAIRKTPEAEKKSERKLKRTSSKKQRKEPTKETMEINKYIILATSLNSDDYTNEQISELYRARWQIEQVFFRLKSLFDFGDIPSKKEETVKAWFFGKLFLAVLAETIFKVEAFSPEEKIIRPFDIIQPVE